MAKTHILKANVMSEPESTLIWLSQKKTKLR